MRLCGLASALLGLSICAATVPAQADDWTLCQDGSVAPGVSIAACTRAIGSGYYRTHDLSVLHYNRGVSYRQQSNDDAALADYSEAIRLDPGYEKPFNNRGNVRKDKGDIDGALADYSEAIRIKPDYDTALANRADLYEDTGDYDLALADLDRVLRIDGGSARAFNLRGVIRKKKDELDRAIADFDSAVRFDPKYVYAYNNRGLSYEKKGDLVRALADFRLALNIDAKSRTAADGVARIEQAMSSRRDPASNVTAIVPVLEKQ
jgi:tetratricopeptide (TPR) repeat protein